MPGGNPQDDTSVTLMMRVQQDPADGRAWEEFAVRYRPMIRDWCLRWGAQGSDADDVAQEVMVKLLSSMRSFRYDPARSFQAWLKTVTRNAWTDLVRSHRPGHQGGGSPVNLAADSHDALEDLEKQMQDALDREIFELALKRVEKRVKPETFQAFRLTALENRAGAEVAAELRMPVAHVFVAKHRVRKLLEEDVKVLTKDLGPAGS